MTASHFLKLRHTLGLTQTQLATRLGLSRRTIARYEGPASAIPTTVVLAVMTMTAAQVMTP